ncbi:methionine adenosyltransferase [Limnoglobus roseus]|uniref:S-adenosylmethionine synthase n=1 Tax=Limnoglobus roseus TaxID=2598579 RepID=A0A5C1AR66_9BACT|nr:methionine adenosyltransferase [Limnoglobus roseus]QEL19694.1 methionine adenosyltransferase [Limnoglobus roseus]
MTAARYLFTSESVSKGHPDKVADQISDAVLDFCLTHDPMSRVACETLVTTDHCTVAGEITTKAPLTRKVVDALVRDVVTDIGYVAKDDKEREEIGFTADAVQVNCLIHSQSPHISQGVDVGGAGDQGMMFGFACDETPTLMPLPIDLSHRLVAKHAEMRKSKSPIAWLRPDAKSQVTVEYNPDGTPNRIHTVVLSTQHDSTAMSRADYFSDDARHQIIKELILPVLKADRPDLIKGELVMVVPGSSPKLGANDIACHINPTGAFLTGGPHGDCGLTGRKIIVDTYGGRGRHGGGAFSGKDPTKVDRSAAYVCRYIAKNIVAAKLARECEVQLSYAIGYPDPLNIWVNTNKTTAPGVTDEKLVGLIREHFKLTPKGIIETLDLRRPIYRATAAHGHFGRDGFPWEKTDKVEALRRAAGV